MAREIPFVDPLGSGFTLHYVNITNQIGQWLRSTGLVFEDFNAGNFGDYDFAATEVGATGQYTANMPAIAAGRYNFVARDGTGGVAQSNRRVASGPLVWTGSAILSEAQLLELMEADEYIVTSGSPWLLEYRRKGSGSPGVVLLTKQLRRLDGSVLVAEGVTVGQKVQ